jgi:cell wall-associated NlpC family hydrolase
MTRALLSFLLTLALVGGVVSSRAPAGRATDATAAGARAPAARKRIEQHRTLLRPDPVGTRAARLALSAVGTPYRWGGSNLGGFDCSGLVRWAYARTGIALPHSAWSQSQLGRRVTRARLRPGDLLFFHGFGHVGIYIGHGRMVHAPQSGERVSIVRLAGKHGRRFETARRLHLVARRAWRNGPRDGFRRGAATRR